MSAINHSWAYAGGLALPVGYVLSETGLSVGGPMGSAALTGAVSGAAGYTIFQSMGGWHINPTNALKVAAGAAIGAPVALMAIQAGGFGEYSMFALPVGAAAGAYATS